MYFKYCIYSINTFCLVYRKQHVLIFVSIYFCSLQNLATNNNTRSEELKLYSNIIFILTIYVKTLLPILMKLYYTTINYLDKEHPYYTLSDVRPLYTF